MIVDCDVTAVSDMGVHIIATSINKTAARYPKVLCMLK